MKQLKIKLHSVTDLITNSSTTIYTYSENSVKPCKELVNEILSLMGETVKCDDIFSLSVEPEEDRLVDMIHDQLEDLIDEDEYAALNIPKDYSKADKRIEQIVKDIRTGAMPKPDWYDELTEDNEEFQCDTNLIITVKDKKYEKLAKKLFDFLYSTHSEEGYN